MLGAQEDRRSPAAIHELVQMDDLHALRSKLEENPSLLNERSSFMLHTPLHLAARHNNSRIVKFLLEWKGTENIELEATNLFGETPLHMAAKNGSNESTQIILEHGAFLGAKTKNGMTPLHLAVWYEQQTDSCDTVTTLLEHNADCRAADDDHMTPLDYCKKKHKNKKLLGLIQSHVEKQRKRKETYDQAKDKMEEFEKAISDIVGLQELKMQIRRWAKVMLFDERRRGLGLSGATRRPPHMAFMGNPGTGKTMVARALGKLLHMVGILPSDKVIEVQRSDLVGEFMGLTGPKTRKKIKEADGGILFIDEAYRLMPMHKSDAKDFGLEAFEEIMSVMENGRVVVIFARYREPMKHVIFSNEGLHRRIKKFYFDDFTTTELAQILHVKMTNQEEGSSFHGFKLHPSCTVEAVAELIRRDTTEELRKKMNGGLIEHLLVNALENLDFRHDFDCSDTELITIMMEDLEAGIRQIHMGD